MIGRWVDGIWNHPANRGRRFSVLARAVGWQLYKRAGGKLDLDVGHGLVLRCYRDSRAASRMIYCRNRPDYDEMLFMERYLRPGDGFIDIGANVGIYTLIAAGLIGPTGRIEAFEPLPQALARLRENVALNRLANVRVHGSAVGREAGTVGLLPGADDTVGRLAGGGEGAALQVPCERLDAVIDAPFAMGKMDIEGAEPLAFDGASGLLAARNPPVWLLEINGALRKFGYTEPQLRDRLRDSGYRLALYDADDRRLRPCEEPWRERDNCLAIADMGWVETRLEGNAAQA